MPSSLLSGKRNPHLRDEENYNHKLWDHLFILADYNLDVDSPYPIPTAEELQQKPKNWNTLLMITSISFMVKVFCNL